MLWRWIARLSGDPRRAARLSGAADALREAVGVPVDDLRRPIHERDMAELRAALTADVFAAEWAAGRAMPLEQAVAEAHGPSSPDGKPRSGRSRGESMPPVAGSV